MCRRAPRTLIDQITVGPNTVTAGRDGTFRYSNQPFRFIGMNIRELVHFDAFEQAEQVSSARHFAGARVIRTWVPHRGKSIPETIAALNSLFASVPADQDSMFIAGAGTAWRCQRPTARARRRSALNRFFNELGADGALQWYVWPGR